MNTFRRIAFVFALLVLVATAAAAGDRSLPAVGTLGSTAVYTTFVALGALADGWVYDVYEGGQVVDLVEVLRAFCSTSATAVREVLAEHSMAEEDRLYLQGIVDAYDLLVKQAVGFLDWVESGDRETYDAARSRAWERIADVLDLEEE